jgi:hypothetical protein
MERPRMELPSTMSALMEARAWFAHDSDVGLPLESTIEEEPEVSQGLHRTDLVGAASAGEGNGGGGGDSVALKQLLEVQELRFVRFSQEADPAEPLFADGIPRSQCVLHRFPGICTGKEYAIVHVHAEAGVCPGPHFMQ